MGDNLDARHGRANSRRAGRRPTSTTRPARRRRSERSIARPRRAPYNCQRGPPSRLGRGNLPAVYRPLSRFLLRAPLLPVASLARAARALSRTTRSAQRRSPSPARRSRERQAGPRARRRAVAALRAAGGVSRHAERPPGRRLRGRARRRDRRRDRNARRAPRAELGAGRRARPSAARGSRRSATASACARAPSLWRDGDAGPLDRPRRRRRRSCARRRARRPPAAVIDATDRLDALADGPGTRGAGRPVPATTGDLDELCSRSSTTLC